MDEIRLRPGVQAVPLMVKDDSSPEGSQERVTLDVLCYCKPQSVSSIDQMEK